LRISSLGVVDDDTDCDGNAILKFVVSVSELKRCQVATNDATDKEIEEIEFDCQERAGNAVVGLAVAVSEGL
jgi:hypothetical protein